MVIPGECPGAAWAAAIAQKREPEGGAAEAAEFVRHARCAGNLPARTCRARRVARLVAQQQTERTALARREREPPRRGQVSLAKLRHDADERAALERLFHGKQCI